MWRTPFALSVILLSLTAVPAAAQPGPAASPPVDLTWIAAGGGVGVGIGEGAAIFPTALVRVNLTSHIAGEVGTGFLIEGRGLNGFYQLLMHVAGGDPDRRVRPVFSTGALGYFETRRIDERRVTLPTGDVAVYPAHRDSELSRPIGFTVGGGARVRVARVVWVEPGLQLWLTREFGAFVLSTNVIVAFGPRR